MVREPGGRLPVASSPAFHRPQSHRHRTCGRGRLLQQRQRERASSGRSASTLSPPNPKADAKAARQKILDGSTFASVARSSLSLNGTEPLVQDGFSLTGSLACVETDLVINEEPNWAGALIQVNDRTGVPAQPFLDSSQVDQGGTNDWLVIELVSKQEAPLSQQLVLEIQGTLLSQSESDLASEQSRLLAKASVTVDPQFGSWNPGKPGSLPEVSPPPLPKSSYLLNRNADLGTS